jgi:hypothetical protein
MDIGGNTALDPSRQSDQLQREGSLAYKERHILTPRPARSHTNRRANNVAESAPVMVRQSRR